MAMYTNLWFPKPSINNLSAVVADQRLAVADTAVGFATTFNIITDFVMFDIQGADVMCTIDGSAPTASNGHRLYNGTSYTWSKAQAQAAKFIRQASTNAAIHASELQC